MCLSHYFPLSLGSEQCWWQQTDPGAKTKLVGLQIWREQAASPHEVTCMEWGVKLCGVVLVRGSWAGGGLMSLCCDHDIWPACLAACGTDAALRQALDDLQ